MKNVTLDVLTAPNCVKCREFIEFWETISGEWTNVIMNERSLLTQEGQEMVMKFHIFASPALILNGEVFVTGGFNKEKFLRKLEEISRA